MNPFLRYAMLNTRVLVVGSTPDYNEIIYTKYGGETLFLTDKSQSAEWTGFKPPKKDECLFDLSNHEGAIEAILAHAKAHEISINGITCFDCEALPLAAKAAERLNLHFSTLSAIENARSKAGSHLLWQKNGVPCPATVRLFSPEDLEKTAQKAIYPCVIKPATGSGSELVFRVDNPEQTAEKYLYIIDRIATHPNQRMYPICGCTLEQFIDGDEFSCDWVMHEGKAEIIRIAEKVRRDELSFGTASAYIVPPSKPVNTDKLKEILVKGAKALGFESMVAMTDFIIQDDRVYLIEMTPRFGGDSLPDTVMASAGFDIFRAALDYAVTGEICIPDFWLPAVSVRIIAERAGTLRKASVMHDHRIISVNIEREEGHRIILPPENYFSRLLGHVVFRPDEGTDIRKQIDEIRAKISVEYA
ncbi:acetyl-CoA carboxylase biotin carboxylase subunit family protein [Seleniivibrio woodruffii]|uniref:ATP-grasp domain-containing protein n=1 Tax=Seleniivibrio woodruffii TaxID=1078050 RepID=UPI0026EA9993|nr:ATP-grasp domain-containing protein [Seleniivibrio woodruffii]